MRKIVSIEISSCFSLYYPFFLFQSLVFLKELVSCNLQKNQVDLKENKMIFDFIVRVSAFNCDIFCTTQADIYFTKIYFPLVFINSS